MSSQIKTSDAKKMGVLALTLVTASNMMGSGVFLLPTNLGKIGAISALCQMLGYSPYESSLAPIIVMVGAILFAQK